jgi:hypothetical protein
MNHFSILKTCTTGSKNDMMPHSLQVPTETEKYKEALPLKLIRNVHIMTCNSTLMKLLIHTVHTTQPFAANALLDSGATACFIDLGFVNSRDLQTQALPKAIPIYNIDRAPNEAGLINQVIDLVCHFQDHSEHMTFYVTQLGSQPIILGHNWLVEHNPEIDWTTGEVQMSQCLRYYQQMAVCIRANRKTREWAKRQKIPLTSTTDGLPLPGAPTPAVEEGN